MSGALRSWADAAAILGDMPSTPAWAALWRARRTMACSIALGLRQAHEAVRLQAKEEAAAAKALGADPEAQRLQSLDERRTGLRNLGATCYMNSLLQVLYHLPDFRRSIYSLPTRTDAEQGTASRVALQSAQQAAAAL